jgi:hypothetical protein
LNTHSSTRHLGLVRQPAHAAPAPRAALPTGGRLLIAAAAFCAVVAAAFSDLSGIGDEWPAIVLIAVLGMGAERLDINIYGDGRISVSVLFTVTAVALFGPAAVLVVCPAIALAGHAGRGRPLYKLIFNVSVFVLAALAAAYAYRCVAALSPYDTRPVEAGAVIVAALAQFAVSSVLVSAIIAFSGDTSARRVWAEKFAWLIPHFVVLGFLAFLLTIAYRALSGYGLLGFTLPVVMTRFTMKQYVAHTERTVNELRAKNAEVEALSEELVEAYNQTLSAFVSALDTRDVETHGHSSRVAELSLELGLALGVKPDSREWLDLRHGAMLHDVGKIGVPDAILRKPGPLDEVEWSSIRAHSMHGFRLLSGVRFLATAAHLVRSHHERFDGGGYPDGLRGDEIPLAARIFAVADSFDAITSDRPYQTARTEAEACTEIARNSGTQFDPRVVEVLLALKQQRRSRAA